MTLYALYIFDTWYSVPYAIFDIMMKYDTRYSVSGRAEKERLRFNALVLKFRYCRIFPRGTVYDFHDFSISINCCFSPLIIV